MMICLVTPLPPFQHCRITLICIFFRLYLRARCEARRPKQIVLNNIGTCSLVYSEHFRFLLGFYHHSYKLWFFFFQSWFSMQPGLESKITVTHSLISVTSNPILPIFFLLLVHQCSPDALGLGTAQQTVLGFGLRLRAAHTSCDHGGLIPWSEWVFYR